MTLTANTITALLFILFGLAVCFSGYRLFRFYLMAIGFIFAFNTIMQTTTPPMDYTNLPILIIAVIAGIIVALVAWLLYRFGVALAGGALGYSIAYLLIQSFGLTDVVAIILMVICVIIGVILAFALTDLIIMISTAIIGANLVATNLAIVLPAIVTGAVVLIIALVLAALGFVTQWQTGGRGRRALV
jgi:hypothetical protein